MKLKELKDKFPEKDIEWRIDASGIKNGKPWGMALAYVTNRAIMERLDSVCGAQNWQNDFKAAPEGGVLCCISIRINDEWVSKWDGANNTKYEAVKGGLSGAMKRAAVQWGVGRYLYSLDVGWANFTENGKYKAVIKDDNNKKHYFKWNPPPLPKWALPDESQKQPPKEPIMTEEQRQELYAIADAAGISKADFAKEWGIVKGKTTKSQAADIIIAASDKYSNGG